MTKTKKKVYSAATKAKVALEALLQQKTIAEIGSSYEVHPTQIAKWKNLLKNQMHEIFVDKRKKDEGTQEKENLIKTLYQRIGELTVERDWLKKKSEQFSF